MNEVAAIVWNANGMMDADRAPPLSHGWLMRYRNYRVFSWPWLWRRTLVFGVLGTGLGTLSVLVKIYQVNDWRISAEEFIVGLGTVLVCIGAGPLLATLVRLRRWPDRRESVGVTCALLLGAGLFASYVGMVEHPFEREVMAPRLIEAHFLTPEQAYDLFGSDSRDKAEPILTVDSANGHGIHVHGRWISLITGMVLYGVFGGGVALSAYFREKRFIAEQARQRQLEALRLQVDEADLQLMVLQAQIEPHFLFNTLASLRSFIHDDTGRAVTMVDALVEHLRATLPQMREGSGTSTLGQQLAICRSYLEVMKLRMSNRLEYAIEVPLACMDAPFPPLMLLTLVENAIKHGIEPKRGSGTIRIVAEQRRSADGARLLVQVIDDGAGLRGGMGHGVGLSNIRTQLALRYRGQGRLSLVGRSEGGTVAALEIPEALPRP